MDDPRELLLDHVNTHRKGFHVDEGPSTWIPNIKENICELQKMYFLKQARGIGMGKKMIETCLHKAKKFGYKKCYIETMYNMESAQKLYLNQGFSYINHPMGNTGHSSCPVWMLKKL